MTIVPRSTSAPGDGTQITSPKVATTTVVGMVLGVLCLFVMVISYQLLSCPCRKRKPARRVPPQDMVINTLHTPSKPRRSFRTCFGVFNKSQKKSPFDHLPIPGSEKGATPEPDRRRRPGAFRELYLSVKKHGAPAPPHTPAFDGTRGPSLRERRALRSLYLDTNLPSPRKPYPGNSTPSPISPALKRMGRVFQFDSTPPETPPFSPLPSTPRTPTGRRHYKQLDDSKYSEWANEPAYRTERPKDAFISPWSPNEGDFPYYATRYSPGFKTLSEPQTPPPLYPPPPAYLPETPIRGSGSTPPTPTRSQTTPASWKIHEPPVSPIVSSLRNEIDGAIGSWEVQDLRAALAETRGEDNSMFVVSNDTGSDEWDASSDLDTDSVHTDESVELHK
ncbi:hypothetical protein OH76DRAFT_1418839 [Lentinus brumalis]|uniref:Uncharacterized protein n=1 Tax=Lentinus brumalis TaxID=2498619 RepID=A0A371D8L1_9APHY|nr:hypothetical protein OH76DRAFT_1418839 [Polyporus brumalis]